MAVRLECLSLCFGNLLYEDAGHRMPSSVGVIVSVTETVAFTNPESHAHLSLVDVVTVALNMTDTMRIYSFGADVHNTING